MSSISYSERRAMFKASPLRFLISVALIAVFGPGLLLLLVWYLECRFQTLVIDNGLIIYEAGFISKKRVELQAALVRSVRVEQSLMQRIFSIGDLYIISSGSSPEIVARAMPGPKRVREIINLANGGLR